MDMDEEEEEESDDEVKKKIETEENLLPVNSPKETKREEAPHDKENNDNDKHIYDRCQLQSGQRVFLFAIT
mgnify:CR=1 FL=1